MMKKSLVTLVLVFATAGFAQQSEPQTAAPAQGAQPATGAGAQSAGTGAQQPTTQQKKEIKDPAEYNAYMSAIGQSDPNQKASALEAFLQQYPNSVMKEDALELLMRTYQQLNNAPKTEEAAQRVLQANPNNVTALALLSYTRRVAAQQGQ